ncbi:hypothetical protein VCHA53O466_140063 [Vibrio chagasii]|nr:hypothetical protein VCHA53O466_140063 [Vibrio chagasii]
MTCTVNYIAAKSKKFNLPEVGKIDVFLEGYICNYNDLQDGLHGWTDTNVARGRVKTQEQRYRNRKVKPTYFAYEPSLGSVVLEVPADYNGTHNDYDSEDYKALGTIMMDESGKLYIETDVHVVYKADLEMKLEKIRAGKIQIGGMDTAEEAAEYTVKLYSEVMAKPDFNPSHGMRYCHD